MPIIDQIQHKLLHLKNDGIKKPSKFGQISRVKASNADQSKIRSGAIKNFTERIHAQEEFFGIAKHANDANINCK